MIALQGQFEAKARERSTASLPLNFAEAEWMAGCNGVTLIL